MIVYCKYSHYCFGCSYHQCWLFGGAWCSVDACSGCRCHMLSDVEEFAVFHGKALNHKTCTHYVMGVNNFHFCCNGDLSNNNGDQIGGGHFLNIQRIHSHAVAVGSGRCHHLGAPVRRLVRSRPPEELHRRPPPSGGKAGV